MQPRVGCGAAILDSDGRLLLVQRRRPPEAGCWGLPGGKLDFGETVEDAIRREILEELGITIALDRLLCVVDQIAPDSHWVAPVWTARIVAGEPAVQEPDVLGGWGWYGCVEMPQDLTLATVKVLDCLNKPAG